MILEIPVRSDIPAYNFQIDLEEVNYQLSFHFNERMGVWIMDIGDEAGDPILSGIPVLTNVPLTDEFVMEALPPGRFIAIDETGANRDAGVNDLGNSIKLVYEES